MKKRILFVLLAVMTAAVLTACTQSDTQDAAGQAVSGTSGSQASGQGSVSGSNSAVSGENTSGEGTSGGYDYSGSGTDGNGTGTAGAVQAGTEATAAGDGYEENISYEDVEEEEISSEEEGSYSEDELDGLVEETNAAAGTEWEGTYLSDGGETLTLTMADASHISFSFANAGISGTAELDGTQAVYHGDDYHIVVFEAVAGAVNVSVLSEEDYDTSESPLNGLYVSQ